MRWIATLGACGLACGMVGCAGGVRRDGAVTPPVAKTVAAELENHGDRRIDDYFWMREREDPEVVAYLEAENRHTEAVMRPWRKLERNLYDEIVARIKKDDASVPYRLDDYFYYTRFEKGREYAIYGRRAGSLDAPEEILLDANLRAKGHDYYNVGIAVSPRHDLLAFAEDTVGRRIYTIRFKDLRTGELLADVIPDVTRNMVWAEDNATLFYVRQDPVTLRWFQVYRHVVGTDPREDRLVYEEPDETFSAFVSKTKSRRYLTITSSQTVSTEVRVLDAAAPQGDPRVVTPRQRDHEYQVDHFGEHFYIRTNRGGAKNFMLMRAPIDATAQENWEEVIGHRDDTLLEGFEVFRDHLVVVERAGGLVRLRIRPWAGGEEHYVDFGEPAYAAWVDMNPELDSSLLRYGYTSLTTPESIYDYDMASRERELLKRQEVLGGFDPSAYRTERLQATASDGTRIPISLVYREDRKRAEGNPLLLYGYGSYGASMDASFRSPRLSLIDRGFTFAICHVRGGEELGRSWYEQGKLLQKKNTFTDFVACAEHLVAQRHADPQRLFAMGGSAGGLLVGAVVNMAPQLFKGVIAAVPFVDVVTTMLDESIPLTTSEYDEWGNPNDPEYYQYILSYSPYDNVEAKDYPAMLVTAGLHDSQVQYWEPAKWVAKLRAMKTDDNILLLKTNMDAGHGGASGRFRQYRETATEYAFLLGLAGLAE